MLASDRNPFQVAEQADEEFITRIKGHFQNLWALEPKGPTRTQNISLLLASPLRFSLLPSVWSAHGVQPDLPKGPTCWWSPRKPASRPGLARLSPALLSLMASAGSETRVRSMWPRREQAQLRGPSLVSGVRISEKRVGSEPSCEFQNTPNMMPFLQCGSCYDFEKDSIF